MRRAILALTAALSVLSLAHGSAALDRSNPGGAIPLGAVVPAPAGARALCTTYAWACAQGTSAQPIGADAVEAIVHINSDANASIAAISDMAQYHVTEKWALPTARGGDCEDFALYKKARLIEAGYSPDRLLLATVLDRQNKPHAVLVVRVAGADLVLDNLRDAVKRWDQTGYTFLRMQDPRDPRRWVATLAGGLLAQAGS